MIGKIKELYPPNYRFIYILFDLALLFYMIAYFVYYEDQLQFERIRFVATLFILLTGTIVCVLRLRGINTYLIWYFIFFMYCMCSVLWAKDMLYATSVFPSLLRILIICCFLSARIKEEKDIEIVLSIYVTAMLYLGIYVSNLMIEFYGAGSFFLHRFGNSFNYNPNLVAIGALFSILILLYKINIENKCILSIFSIIFFTCIILMTASKKGLLGLFIGVAMMFYFRKKGVKQIQALLVALVIGTGLLIALMNIQLFYDLVGYRIDELLSALSSDNVGYGSTSIRINLLETAIDVWIHSPVFGVGLNNFFVYDRDMLYSHCNYIEILADLGVIGFIFYYYIPIKLMFVKIDTDNELLILLKSIVATVLIMDIGMVSYQEFRIQIFYFLFYIAAYRVHKTNIGSSQSKHG